MEVLGNGYINLVNYMGGDLNIVNAARKSFNRSSEKWTDNDTRLLNYLYKNKHCYEGYMEVLTTSGWKRWDELGHNEEFLIPNQKTGRYTIERLDIVSFPVKNEKMVTYSNSRMNFSVTEDHRMWFKNKYKKTFEIYRAKDMKKWGHFDGNKNYSLFGIGYDKNGEMDNIFKFLGFFIGDGSWSNKGAVVFHLKKKRKKEYLLKIINDLGLEFSTRESTSCAGATIYYVKIGNLLADLTTCMARSKDKDINIGRAFDLGYPAFNGLLDGLINSDGSIKKSRPQISFSSTSKKVLDVFQLCCSILGHDCIVNKCGNSCILYTGSRASLESRKQYYGEKNHNGSVYCATSSTGLLAVRGGSNTYGFVCGNSTPFEMVEFMFEVKAPLFVIRQWQRHRSWSYNEVSRRYTSDGLDFYFPDKWRFQSEDNKQSSHGEFEDNIMWSTMLKSATADALAVYNYMIDNGVCREQARMVLPQNMMVEMVAKVDLHNLMHFLRLRDHEHAQLEIREYAKAIKTLIKPYVPHTMELMENG